MPRPTSAREGGGPALPPPAPAAERGSKAVTLERGRRVCSRHLSKLEAALRAVLSPHPEYDPPFVIWVSGERGMGKTTLLEAAREKLAPEGMQFLRGEFHPGTGEILEPLLCCARVLVKEVREHAQRGDADWHAAWRQIVARHAPALAAVLPEMDWGEPLASYPPLDPRYERNRLVDHLAGLFLRVAEEVPLVLEIEGAEYLDSVARECILALARVVRTRREGRRISLPLSEPPRLAVVLTTTREDRQPLPLSDSEILPLTMRGLGREEFARILAERFGEEIPLSIREKLYRLTRGNSFDLETRMSWESSEEGGGDAEERIKRLLDIGPYELACNRRVRELPDQERMLLQVLTVLAKPVSIGILQRVAGLAGEELETLLGRVLAGGWIALRDRSVVSLRHERMRDPIESTISGDVLRSVHRRAAEVIQAEYEARPYRRFQEVYYHFARGPRDAIAVEAAFRAADEALRLYDFEGALRIYRDLLQVLDHGEPEQVERGVASITDVLTESTEADEGLLLALEGLVERNGEELSPENAAGMWRRLGAVAHRWGFADKEFSYYQRGFRALEGRGPSQERMKIYAALAGACLSRRRYEETLRYCREGLEVSELHKLTQDSEFLELCRVTEEIHFRRGEYVEALEFEEQYLRLARVQGSAMEILDSLLRLSFLHEQRGNSEKAHRYLLESLPVARSTGSRLLEARTNERIGYLHARREEWQEAMRAFHGALEVHSEIGDEERTIRLLGALGMVSLFTLDAEEGARNFRLYALYQGMQRRRALPPQVPGHPCDYRNRSERDEEIRGRNRSLERDGISPRVRADTYLELADLRRDRGEMQASKGALRKGLRIAFEEDLEAAPYLLRLGILHRMQGEIGSALRDLQTGLEAMAAAPDRECLAETNVQVGLLHMARGNYRSTLSSLTRGLRSYLEDEHETGVTHTLIQIGRAFLRMGRWEAAEELGQAALSLADTLEVERLEAEAWLLLGAARGRSKSDGSGEREIALAREIFHKLGILEGRCRALLEEARLHFRAGEPALAQELCSEAVEIARDLTLGPLMAHALALRGAIEGDRRNRHGDFLRSLKTLEAALVYAKSLGDLELRLQIHTTVAEIYHQRKRPAVVSSHLRRAREILEKMALGCPPPLQSSFLGTFPALGLMKEYTRSEESDRVGNACA